VGILRKSAALVVVVMCVAAPSALASGGTNSGGVNAGGTSTGGGGGGSTVSSGTCANITGFSNTTGYYSVFAAVWTPFAVSSSCNGQIEWTMTYTNTLTGAVDFTRLGLMYIGNSGLTVDEDWASFSTPYTVTLRLTDYATGALLDSRTALVTTKAPKSTTGA
jgi:hypothetical protein